MPKIKNPALRETPWAGPCGEGSEGGVTQSMLGRWLCCRERFRLLVVEGLRTVDEFSHRLEYGQMWHTCEEAHAKGVPYDDPLMNFARDLCRRYPMQQEQIVHWMNVCKAQFPVYVKYWAKHPDVKSRTPLLQEQVFDVPYNLPLGRVVRLRGKWDSVDLVGKGKSASVYLQENKTKGDIVEQQLKTQLQFDLQTMFYLTAMDWSPASLWQKHKIAGVRYNVIRRPLSGGKGSIRKHQPTKSNPAGESDAEFYSRLACIIEEDPSYFFMRWQVEVTKNDLDKFRHRFLDPALEMLCDWWDWITSPAGREDPFGDHVHYQFPYGVYNPLTEGRSTDLDEHLASGSELGLTRDAELFKELV